MADLKIKLDPFTVAKSSGILNQSPIQTVLKWTGIKQLKPPGSDSNYLNWKFVVGIHFQATKVLYVLEALDISQHPDLWAQDNTATCSVITKTIHPSNYQYIRDFEDDAAGMWDAIKSSSRLVLRRKNVLALDVDSIANDGQ
jgi:hypothetical protein